MEIEQSRERQICVLDHVDVEQNVDATDLVDVRLVEGERGTGAQRGPFATIEVDVVRLRHDLRLTLPGLMTFQCAILATHD